MNKKVFKFIDLFAGVGGIRMPFDKLGGDCVFTSEIDNNACKTYSINYGKCKQNDITQINIKKDIPNFDILLAGFPCQSFSIAGKQKGFKDTGRGDLFFHIIDIIKEKKPNVVFLENVKNLKTHNKGETFKIMLKELKKIGYHFKYEILNAMEYGNIPQNRERIYMIGFRDKKKMEKFKFPEKIKLSKSFKNLLEKKIEEKYYYKGKPLYERIKNEIKSKDLVYQWRRQYVRENKKGVVPTLTANMGTGGHNVPIIKDNKGIRKLTPRETFSIQGFPKSFKMPLLSDSALYKQAGNSVVIPIIEKIAKKIISIL